MDNTEDIAANCARGGGSYVITTDYLPPICGFHQQMPCERQGKPVKHEGFVAFTLYPCNAPQTERAERQEAGVLELKLAPGSA